MNHKRAFEKADAVRIMPVLPDAVQPSAILEKRW